MGDRELWGDLGQGGVVQIGLEMSLGGEKTRKKKKKVPGEPGCGQLGGVLPEEGGSVGTGCGVGGGRGQAMWGPAPGRAWRGGC